VNRSGVDAAKIVFNGAEWQYTLYTVAEMLVVCGGLTGCGTPQGALVMLVNQWRLQPHRELSRSVSHLYAGDGFT